MDINAHDLEGKLGDLGDLFDLIASLVTDRLQRSMNELSPSLSVLSLAQDAEREAYRDGAHRDGATLRFRANMGQDDMVNMMARLDGSKDVSRRLHANAHVHVLCVHKGGNMRLLRKLVVKN